MRKVKETKQAIEEVKKRTSLQYLFCWTVEEVP